jgi:biotin synthase-related radical SAM superfamily protein
MPLYVIEREFAEELDLTSDEVREIDEINADEGVRWVFSFLSADRRHTYCLYEAPSPDAILAAAKRANVPADVIVEVGAASADLVPRMRDWAVARAGVTR